MQRMHCRPLAAQQLACTPCSLSRLPGSACVNSRPVAVHAVASRPSTAGDGSSSSSLNDNQWGELTTAAPPSSSSRRAPQQPVDSRPRQSRSSSRGREDSAADSNTSRWYTGNGNSDSPPARPRRREQPRVGTSSDQHASSSGQHFSSTPNSSSRLVSWHEGRSATSGSSSSRDTTYSSSRPSTTAGAAAKRKIDKKAKKAALPPPSNQPCCYGCGAPLQTAAPAAAGYVVPAKFELKQKHKQLNQVLCARCSELCNGAMIPAVQDFTQKAWAQQQAGLLQQQPQQQPQHKQPPSVHKPAGAAGGLHVRTNAPAAAPEADAAESKQQQATGEPETLLGKVLITPEQLRDKISEVRSVKAVVVLLVDLLDASGTLMSKVRDMVGNNPIILVGTKMDVLPAGCHPKVVAEWLSESAARKRLQVASCHLVSSHTGEGIAAVTAKICRERKGRDVFVVGAANVGKSAFVRAMLKEMSSLTGGNFDAAAMSTSRYLPVESAMPGTTLGLIALKAFDSGGTLYDTPGVHLHHRIPHMLTPDELKLLHPRRRLTAFTPPTPLEVMYQQAEDDDTSDAGTGHNAVNSSDGVWFTDPHTGVSKPRTVTATYVWGGLVRVDVLNAPPSTQFVFYGPKSMKVYDLPLLGDDQFEFDMDTVEPGHELFCQESVQARGGLVSHDLTVPAAPIPTNACLADIAVSGLPGWIGVYAPFTKREIHLQVWTPRGVEVFLRPPLPCPSPLKPKGSEDPPELLEIGGALDAAEADQEWVAHRDSLGLGAMSKQDEEVVKMLLFGDEAAGFSGIVDEVGGDEDCDLVVSSQDGSGSDEGLHVDGAASDVTADEGVDSDSVQDSDLLQQLVAGVPVTRAGAGSSSSRSAGAGQSTNGTSRRKSGKAAGAVAYDDEFGSIFVDTDGDSAVTVEVSVGDGVGEQHAQQQPQTSGEPPGVLAAAAGSSPRRRRRQTRWCASV